MHQLTDQGVATLSFPRLLDYSFTTYGYLAPYHSGYARLYAYRHYSGSGTTTPPFRPPPMLAMLLPLESHKDLLREVNENYA